MSDKENDSGARASESFRAINSCRAKSGGRSVLASEDSFHVSDARGTRPQSVEAAYCAPIRGHIYGSFAGSSNKAAASSQELWLIANTADVLPYLLETDRNADVLRDLKGIDRLVAVLHAPKAIESTAAAFRDI